MRPTLRPLDANILPCHWGCSVKAPGIALLTSDHPGCRLLDDHFARFDALEKVVKDLKSKVDATDCRNAALEEDNSALKAQVAALEKDNSALKAQVAFLAGVMYQVQNAVEKARANTFC